MKKIVIIGGGSLNWSFGFVRQFADSSRASDFRISLVDIDAGTLELVYSAEKKYIAESKSGLILEKADNLESGLAGADFILITISTGGLNTMKHDLEIPEKYGIRHTVGDTIGPGGWSRCIRNVPVFYRIAEAAKKIFLPYKHNMFMPEDREAVSAVARVIQALNPELVFIPWPHDNHYDHARTARASLEALSYINRFAGGTSVQIRLQEILAYEISSWQTRDFTPDFYVNIGDEIEIVTNAIKAFHILGKTADLYLEEKLARSRSLGAGARFQYAEGFKHLGPMFPIKSILPEIFGGDLLPAGSVQYPWGAKFF